jgi:hypothetical protein
LNIDGHRIEAPEFEPNNSSKLRAVGFASPPHENKWEKMSDNPLPLPWREGIKGRGNIK